MHKTFGPFNFARPPLFIIVLILIVFAFEVAMFVNVIRNQFISRDRKLLWCLGMLVLHPFVAIGYLLTDYKKQQQ